MNTNNEINPTLKSHLRERFFIFIVNNFGVGFFNMGNIKERKKKYLKEYYKKNEDKIKNRAIKWGEDNKEYRKEYLKKWYENNKEKVKKSGKIYREKNQKKISEKRKIYTDGRKKERNRLAKERRENDYIFKLNLNISGGIRRSLKNNKNGYKWETLVDYTQIELKQHLESQFKDGMTWDNYGKGNNKWQIDHKIPMSLFNITSIKSKGFKKCWALENLQPLWAEDNLEKSNKLFY